MRRKALLIGSPLDVGHENHLRGVEPDIRNMYAYLKSATGGAWAKEEIIWLINPSTRDVAESLKWVGNGDLAFVYFSGHGVMVDGDQYVQINQNRMVEWYKFITPARIQLSMVDACRNEIFSHFDEGLSGPGLVFEEGFKREARYYYDGLISRLPSGKLTLFSCGEGEQSNDTPSGGDFTKFVMNWASAGFINQQHPLFNAGGLLRAANKHFSSDWSSQTPDVHFTNADLLKFPLLLNPKLIMEQFGSPFPKKEAVHSKSGGSGAGWLLAGGLLLAAVALGGKR